MKSRPILFSTPMVRAILRDRKTQTRRVVKQVPHWDHGGRDIMKWGLSGCYTDDEGRHWLDIQTDVDDNSHEEIFCPYGVVGDRLWVREAFRLSDTARDCACYEPCGCRSGVPMYRADCAPEDGPWKPSIHMPRRFSRITMEVTGVRVERLQDITEEDAMAEGVEMGYQFHGYAAERHPPTPVGFRPMFKRVWDELYVARGFGWDANPFVWVVSFKRIAEGSGCQTE